MNGVVIRIRCSQVLVTQAVTTIWSSLSTRPEVLITNWNISGPPSSRKVLMFFLWIWRTFLFPSVSNHSNTGFYQPSFFLIHQKNPIFLVYRNPTDYLTARGDGHIYACVALTSHDDEFDLWDLYSVWVTLHFMKFKIKMYEVSSNLSGFCHARRDDTGSMKSHHAQYSDVLL